MTRKEAEQAFKEKFNHKFSGRFEYIGGYINSNGKFKCRCVRCGEVKWRSADCIRNGHRDIMCIRCHEEEVQRKKLITQLVKTIKNKIRIEKSIIKTQEALEAYNRKYSRQCAECGKAYMGTRMFCSEICRRKYDNRKRELRRSNKLKTNGIIQWDISLTKLIKRDKNVCHICGEKCNSKDYVMDADGNFIAGDSYPSIDHVLPVSKGGTHTWDNIKLAHRHCNTLKRDKELYTAKDGQMTMAI